MVGGPDARAKIPGATWCLTALLMVIGAAMLGTGLGYGGPLQTGLFVGATMFVWTTLLPRLGVLKPLGAFFASHSLAAGTYWAILTLGDGWMPVVGPSATVLPELSRLVVCALAAGAIALGVGLLLDRAVRRGGPRIRRALASALVLSVIAASAAVGGAMGEAQRPVERIRSAPIVARIARGQRVAREPLAILRASDGSFAPVAAGNLDWLVSEGPASISGFRADAGRACREIGPDEPIEVREMERRLFYTPEHALDDPDAGLVPGCVYDRDTLERVLVRGTDLPRPLAASDRMTSIALGALAVAILQLLIAATALARHAKVADAREAQADGDGWAVLADGTRVKCDGPPGPVLVALSVPHADAYRTSAAKHATVISRGSRMEADAAMHESTCVALVGATGALLAVALPLAAAIAIDFVVPL